MSKLPHVYMFHVYVIGSCHVTSQDAVLTVGSCPDVLYRLPVLF